MARAGGTYQRHGIVAAALTVAALCLYIRTLAPSVVTVFDDSLEFQLVPYLLAIPHPTGYPLYALLGGLFTRLPVGDVAYRVNLLSATGAALTIGLVYLSVLSLRARRDGLTEDRAGALGAGLAAVALAVSPVFWGQATIAEVYTLNLVLVASLLLVLLRLAAADSLAAWSRKAWTARLAGLGLLFGLGLAHHRTIVLLAPAAAWTLWRAWPRRYTNGDAGNGKARRLALAWQQWLLVGGALLAPLALYLYLPLRAEIGSLDGTYQNTVSGFWRYVTAAGYGGFIFDNPLAVERGLGFYAGLFWRQFGPLGLLLGGLGLALVLRRGAAGAASVIAFVCYGGFNLFYRVADIEVFFLPVFLVWAIWLGLGAGWLVAQLAAWAAGGGKGRLAGRALTLGIYALALAQIGGLVVHNWEQVDRSDDWRVFDYGRDMLSQPLVAGAAVVGIQGEMTLLRYFQATQALRQDIQPVTADAEEKRLAVVGDLLRQGKGVYLTRELAGAPAAWSLYAVGPLIRVLPEAVVLAPAVQTVLATPVTAEIVLYGYTFSQPPAHDLLAPLRLTLVWQVAAPVSTDLKVSARLTAADGRMVAQADGVPVHFAYPTTAWRAGEYVTDVYDLFVVGPLPAGEYTPVVIVYDPAQGAAEVGRVTLPALYLP